MFGRVADLERLPDLYDVTTDPSERVEIISAVVARRLQSSNLHAQFISGDLSERNVSGRSRARIRLLIR